ncbi:substrate-binding domain-containing protein [Pseudobacteroides cellulosolvens]|uniref:Periplasmic binding protein domain containing protein n=1 Tax=Pseudobacteroides cellulosolvens ATCC 35603 = DSM 2933 TaxID=398512 RepID=A0A0L6JWH0_9FIRM|nr:substrate-binding domain-containing protein [Pseudobacteroides cellulosolvens]KNY29965.1 Periplasmic binding protein domain containing protein [Pseudobacteroides cellulosolvens ATCC 35603 = DSM 2933]
MKTCLRWVLFFIILSVAIIAGGCGSRSDDSLLDKAKSNNPEKPDKRYKIGISLPSLQEDRWITDFKVIKEECEKLGIELIYENAEMDAVKQATQCSSMIMKGIQLLILIPYDTEKAAVIVREAHSKNVKVLSYDRLIMNEDIDLYISFDNEKVGELIGKSIIEAVPKGNYVFFTGAPNDRNSYYISKGVEKYLKPLVDKRDIKVVTKEAIVDWNPDNAFNLMNKAIKDNKGNIQAVIAPNDGTAGGCIRALADNNLAGKIPVTGQDAEVLAARRIIDGTQLMTVFKDTRMLGRKAIEVSLKMINNEKIDTTTKINNDKKDIPAILLAPISVNKDNLDELLVKSGYLNKDAVYRR